jgi:tetratricopeptide (TPR) repeat protein
MWCRTAIALALLFVPHMRAAGPPENEFSRRIAAANGSLQKDRFAEAIGVLRPALRQAEQFGVGDYRVAVALNKLGYAYRMLGRCVDSIRLLRRAMAIWKTADAPPAFERFGGLNLLASYLECGDSDSAARLWTKTLAPLAGSLAPESEDRASLYTAGAQVWIVRKQYDEAEALLTAAIAVWEKDAAQHAAHLRVARSNRGVERAYLGRFEEAITDVEAARKTLPSSDEKAAPFDATVLNNVGLVYLMNRQYDSARPCFVRAVSILERTGDSQEAPAILANYALLLRKTGEAKAAVQMQDRARQTALRLGRLSEGQAVDVSELRAVSN